MRYRNNCLRPDPQLKGIVVESELGDIATRTTRMTLVAHCSLLLERIAGLKHSPARLRSTAPLARSKARFGIMRRHPRNISTGDASIEPSGKRWTVWKPALCRLRGQSPSHLRNRSEHGGSAGGCLLKKRVYDRVSREPFDEFANNAAVAKRDAWPSSVLGLSIGAARSTPVRSAAVGDHAAIRRSESAKPNSCGLFGESGRPMKQGIF